MKHFLIIFGFYVLAISCLPCNDNAVCDDYDQQISLRENLPEDGDLNESCTPFCICACCGCPGVNLHSTNRMKIPTVYSPDKPIPLYNPYFSQDFFLKIWQPPKIG